MVGLGSPIAPIVLIWRRQIFIFFWGGALNDALRGTSFEDDESVVHAVRTWLREQETSWYREGTHALFRSGVRP